MKKYTIVCIMIVLTFTISTAFRLNTIQQKSVSSFFSNTSINADPKPVLSGHTFTSSNGETLDFYDDYVIYQAEGSTISRRGDYTIGSMTNITAPTKYALTVKIYISDRVVTWKGETVGGGSKVTKLILNGTEWKYSY